MTHQMDVRPVLRRMSADLNIRHAQMPGPMKGPNRRALLVAMNALRREINKLDLLAIKEGSA